ncbi:predicted protein [Arabidopsis lyrata subsp. lyrata]|uniref:Predicted protein n=1 Tax=Arabidopsis lyrata subsp. lyrata TaxID=81972 RepID=D7KER7_ARALL|nr:predicted protein [Arabidopsis lyrata subsp. lyrata]
MISCSGVCERSLAVADIYAHRRNGKVLRGEQTAKVSNKRRAPSDYLFETVELLCSSCVKCGFRDISCGCNCLLVIVEAKYLALVAALPPCKSTFSVQSKLFLSARLYTRVQIYRCWRYVLRCFRCISSLMGRRLGKVVVMSTVNQCYTSFRCSSSRSYPLIREIFPNHVKVYTFIFAQNDAIS